MSAGSTLPENPGAKSNRPSGKVWNACRSIEPAALIGAAIRAARRGADPCELGLHLLALRQYDARRPDAAVRLTADWLARHLTGLSPSVSGQRGGDL
ncbi:hypothetical protein ACLNGM_02195 [Aureimonas phyllosphaerae]